MLTDKEKVKDHIRQATTNGRKRASYHAARSSCKTRNAQRDQRSTHTHHTQYNVLMYARVWR